MLFLRRHSIFDRIHLSKDFTITERIAINIVPRKPHSIKTRMKISLASKGKPKSEAHCQKLSEVKKRLFTEGKLKSPCYWKGKTHTLEYKKRLSIIKQGTNQREKNGQWQGGISFLPYTPEFNGTFRQIIRDDYNNKCFITGLPEPQNKRHKKLAVHHINYNKLDNRQINLVPILQRIHSATNSNRDYWFALFCYLKNVQPEEMLEVQLC